MRQWAARMIVQVRREVARVDENDERMLHPRQWFGPVGHLQVACELDLKVGGDWAHRLDLALPPDAERTSSVLRVP